MEPEELKKHLKVRDYTEEQLRGALTKAGLNTDLVNKGVNDYLRYREAEIENLPLLSLLDVNDILRMGGVEAINNSFKNIKHGEEILHDILVKYLDYIEMRRQITERYNETKNWGEVLSTIVYSDLQGSVEAYIDVVEAIYKTKIKDAKHYIELCGTPENIEDAEELLTIAKLSKYFRAIQQAIKSGAIYEELLEIKPKDYGLPKTWKGTLAIDQYSCILWAISIEFLVNEPTNLTLIPDLRSIATELQAPYSVLLDCYNLTNRK